MRIIAERGVNLNIFPMIESRGKKFEGDYVIKRQGSPIFIGHESSRWDYNCYKVMDFIASKIRDDFDNFCYKKFGKRNVPITNFSGDFILLYKPGRITDLYREDMNDANTQLARNVYSINFNIKLKDIVKKTKLQTNTVKQTLEKINNFKFKTDYKIKSESNIRDTKGNIRLDFSNGISNLNDNFTPFIQIKELNYNIGKDNKHYNQEYNFGLGPMFSSKLSTAFMHNIFTGGYNTIKNPKKFYSLSIYANILYRLRYLQFNNITPILKFNNVMQDLGLSTNNITLAKKKFKKLVEELVDNKFIEITEFNNDELFYKTSFPKKKIKKKSKKKEDKKDQIEFFNLQEFLNKEKNSLENVCF